MSGLAGPQWTGQNRRSGGSPRRRHSLSSVNRLPGELTGSGGKMALQPRRPTDTASIDLEGRFTPGTEWVPGPSPVGPSSAVLSRCSRLTTVGRGSEADSNQANGWGQRLQALGGHRVFACPPPGRHSPISSRGCSARAARAARAAAGAPTRRQRGRVEHVGPRRPGPVRCDPPHPPNRTLTASQAGPSRHSPRTPSRGPRTPHSR
jgi:hypothetical protein